MTERNDAVAAGGKVYPTAPRSERRQSIRRSPSDGFKEQGLPVAGNRSTRRKSASPPEARSDETRQEKNAPFAEEQTTWIQCESSTCNKWRRVKASEVPDGEWFCKDSKDPMHCSCDAPQELPDEDIDRLLEIEASSKFVAAAKRPPLESCSSLQFTSDLTAFLEWRSELSLAKQIRENRVMCNGAPMDFLGLYRAVVDLGGLEANQSYDEAGRWTGRINFSGSIFPKMRNYTANNKATSVGNQLLTNYKKFLLSYERAYSSVDIKFHPEPMVGKHSGASAGAHVNLRAARRKSVRTVIKPEFLIEQEQDKLASLAVVASMVTAKKSQSEKPKVDSMEALAKRRLKHGTANLLESECRAKEIAEDLNTIRQEVERQDSRKWVVLPNDQSLFSAPWSRESGRAPSAGEMLLVEDSYVPSRLWPVVVAAFADLPSVVVNGGVCNGPDGTSTSGRKLGVLSTRQDAEEETDGPTGPRAVFPALLLGTSMLGWVAASRCRIYSQADTQASAAEWMPQQIRDLRLRQNGSRETKDEGPTEPWLRRNILSCAVKLAEISSLRSPALLGFARRILLGLPTLNLTSLHPSPSSGANIAFLQMHAHFRSKTSISWTDRSLAQEAAALHHCAYRQSRAREHVRAASMKLVASRLLALESDLPASVFRCSSSVVWQAFRSAVQDATHIAALIPQVLFVAHQLPASILRPKAAKTMWSSLQRCIMIAPPPGHPAMDTAGSHPLGSSPSCAALDNAVAAIEDAINWEAAAAAWELGTVRNTSGAMVVAMVQSCPHVKLADVDDDEVVAEGVDTEPGAGAKELPKNNFELIPAEYEATQNGSENEYMCDSKTDGSNQPPLDRPASPGSGGGSFDDVDKGHKRRRT